MLNISKGIAIGKVTNNDDPEGEGRVEVLFAHLGENSPRRWCSVVSTSAGGDRGIYFMPELDDEVVVIFDQGDFDHAFVLGYLWNPVNMPPSRHPGERMIRSKGHTIRFVDSAENGGNQGALIIQDAHDNVITMTNGVVSIHARGHMAISARTMTIMGRPVNPLGGEV